MIKKLQQCWDWWIYWRAYHAFRRLYDCRCGSLYFMELHLRRLREERPLSPALMRAVEYFHKTMPDRRPGSD